MSHQARTILPEVVRKFLFILAVLVVYGNVWIFGPQAGTPAGFHIPGRYPASLSRPAFESRFASHGATPSVHSATLVEVSEGKLRAFWYGGTREGAQDVAIYTSLFSPETGLWTRELPVITRSGAQRSLYRYIKKLGNPVAIVDEGKQLWLFFVSVSVGGWSGSSVNVMVSQDEGVTWGPPRRLVASPFLNLSTLVKGTPLLLEDGSIALPAYHELIGVFGELLRINRAGQVIGKRRLSRGTNALQPVVVPRSSTEAVGLMRYAGPSPARILSVRTTDGGIHWSRPIKVDLPNPDAAISCVGMEDGALLLVFNNSERQRDDLSLAYSTNHGETWRVIHSFEKETSEPSAPQGEFSYPYLIQAHNGDFQLLYTWHRSHIKHVRFNEAWLKQKLQ